MVCSHVRHLSNINTCVILSEVSNLKDTFFLHNFDMAATQCNKDKYNDFF